MPFENKEIIVTNNKETVKEIFDLPPYRIGYYITRNLTPDKENEDSLFIFAKNDDLIFGVSDGAGGHPKGKEASELTTTKVVELVKKNKHLNFPIFFEEINQSIRDLKVGAHCTFSLCHIQGNQFRSYSVGDSEIVYWNSSGKKMYSNIPQSEVGYLIQSGQMDQEESLDSPDRHYVSNLIGDEAIRIESTSKLETRKGNTILVGSDGLFDNLSHDQLTEILTQGAFENSFEKVEKICSERDLNKWRKDDDISFIVIRKIQAD
jgi:serine/threonine protein phosphatase PrpC